MAGETVGLDLASQTGQSNIESAIEDLADSGGLANQAGQTAITNALTTLATKQESIKQAIDNFSAMLQAKPMGGGGGGDSSGGDDVMNLMDLYYLGYNSYTYNTSNLMDSYYENDDLVNSFEISGYLLEYGIQNESNVGEFFSRMTDIDNEVDWETLDTIAKVAADSDAVTAILANTNAKRAISISTTALLAISAVDSNNTVIADRVGYLLGFRTGLYSTFNALITPDANKRLLAGSSTAIAYLVGDSSRAAILLSKPDVVRYILKNETTKSIFLASANVISALNNNSSLMTIVTSSKSLMLEIVESTTLMGAFIENSTFVDAIMTDQDIINALLDSFDDVGLIVIGSTVGFAALMNSNIAKNTLASNDDAVNYVLEKWCGITLGDTNYTTIASTLSVVCSNVNAIVSLEYMGRIWNAFASRIWTLINASTSYVTAIYSVLTNYPNRFTAGSRVDQDSVANANSSCSSTGKIYACKLAGWSNNTSQFTNLFINGDDMGHGCREVTTSYGMSDSEVNAIGVGASTFVETGDGRVSVVPYTIVTS